VIIPTACYNIHKMKKSYPQSATQSQKIPFWRRRWFWGVVVSATSIWSFKTFFDLYHGTSLIFILTKGILFFLYRFPSGIAMFLSLTDEKPIYNLFVAIYYLVIALLLHQTLKNRKVKIKYPIILLSILFLNTLTIAITGYLFWHPT